MTSVRLGECDKVVKGPRFTAAFGLETCSLDRGAREGRGPEDFGESLAGHLSTSAETRVNKVKYSPSKQLTPGRFAPMHTDQHRVDAGFWPENPARNG